MKKLGIICSLIFLALVAFYFFVLKPEKYEAADVYDEIMNRGYIKVGINADLKPFGFKNQKNELVGYDVDLAKYIAQYLLKSPDKLKLIPVTPANRMIKISTGEVDMVIATMTITPQRQEIIGFSVPYDSAGQALLVNSNSRITSVGDLAGQNIGVIWGTTAEKNMLNLVPTANILGFKNYKDAYNALKMGRINAITSDDTILSSFAIDDGGVKLLPKRYSREPYGIGFKKGKAGAKLKENLDSAIDDMKQKNIINRIHNTWLD